MIISYKILFAILASLIALVSYTVYIHDIVRGTTKPHVISWFVWAVLEGIISVAQVVSHGGAGSFVAGFTSVMCLVIFFLTLFKSTIVITRFDWACLAAAVLGISIWYFSHEPLFAVIIAAAADCAGFLPTYRKAFYKPFEETALMYFLSAVKYLLTLAALNTYSLVTGLSPVTLIVENALFCLMIFVRRKQLAGHFA